MYDGYKRKHESGFEKRKKKEEKEDAIRKMKGSLLKFMNIDSSCNNDASLTSDTSAITANPLIPQAEPTDAFKQNETETDVINEQVCQTKGRIHRRY
jgi:hypothetical protein